MYENCGAKEFCIAEKTVGGSLLTKFTPDGEVLSQKAVRATNVVTALKEYAGVDELKISSDRHYAPTRLNAVCNSCNRGELVRELDLSPPEQITEVPVVPIFVCTNCKKRFYTLTDEYLKSMVAANMHLFEHEELRERDTDEAMFIRTLQDYIVRMFAAKKISRVMVNR